MRILVDRFWISALGALVLLGANFCVGVTVTGGGVSLTVDADGVVRGIRVGDHALTCKPAPFVSLCDVTKSTDFVPGAVTESDLSRRFEVSFAGQDAQVALVFEQREKSIRVTCELIGKQDLPARGVLLRFLLPVDCVGWKWHDDMQTSRTITHGENYEVVQALRAWPDLPEWADKPNLRIGAANRNFCTVLTGPVGLCVAPDIERPIIFRTAYDATARQLQLVYDLALSPDTDPPNRWSFAFDLYACDTEWGFRAALQAYYTMYPHLFKNFVPEPGQWMAFTDLKHLDNANEFHFALQEGARDPAYDDKIGVLDCTYFTHAGQFVRIPNHDPEKDPPPPAEVILAETEKTFKKRTKLSGVYREVGLHDARGQFQIPKTRVYGHYIAQFNLDPDLRYGKWHLERTAMQTEGFAKKGGRLDGFYYDGLTTGLNYRTDHFKHSLAPPLWDPASNKPVLNNFFNSCEFARAAAELLRPRGQITMMNGALHATFYVAPWLDVFGAETGLRISRSSFNFIRTIIYHKPMLTLLKGNYEKKIGHGEIELFMKRALAYGIFPGFFDWPPSGLGPGGRYWAHPEYYERDRDLFRKYLPLVKTLAAAGWEPVTHVRSSNGDVFVERYGPDADWVLWLTLLNETSAPSRTSLMFDAKPLGIDVGKARCVDVLNGGEIDLCPENRSLLAEVVVPADDVLMLQIATPEQAARWRLSQAQDAVVRGATMRQVDEAVGRPAVAVHWRPDRGSYGRDAAGDGYALVLKGVGKEVSGSQWAMLFQPEPASIKLRVRASAQGLEGKAQVRCRIAWVTSSFTHRDWRYLTLDNGTYEAREFELDITAEHALRSIWVQPRMPADAKGIVKILSVTLEDRFGDDYVVDPTFQQWYKPVPTAMRARLAKGTQELTDALVAARTVVREDVRSSQSVDAMLRAGAVARLVREWIVAQKAENGCRRALRDIETAEEQLGVALGSALGVAAPRLEGPARAAPGDEVSLRLSLQPPPGLVVTTEILGDGGIVVRPFKGGARITVPTDAQPGTILGVTGLVRIGKGDRQATVRTTHSIEIAQPIEIAMETAGADSETGAFHVRATIRNNRTKRVTAQTAVSAPSSWKLPNPRDLTIVSGEAITVDMVVSPNPEAQAGSVPVTMSVTSGKDTARATKRLLYIPPSANLLRNPGFEDGAWSGGEQDTAVAYSGVASLRLHNQAVGKSQASQTVTLNQKRPCPILVRCASKGQNVSGTKGRGYCLYVDIYYTDGTPLYGRIYPFATGTTEWHVGEKIIEPEKPIAKVNVYLLLRGKSGTVWFDDVAVMEDPRRKGNVARDATVTVDSSYSGYSAVPLTDGVLHVPPDAHWTEESWASADVDTEHSVELAFEEACGVRRAVIYWSLDGGTAKTAREVQLQVSDGNTWRTVATAKPAATEEETVLEPQTALTARRLRLFQPKGMGPRGRPNIMWIREIEIFVEE